MKKLFILISLLFACIAMQAQESATQDYSIPYAQTWGQYAPTTVPNATTATDSVWYYTFLKESMKPLLYDIKLRLDSSGGTAKRTTIILQTKTWASDTYTDLETKYWVTGADTTITFTNVAVSTISGTFEADSTMVFTSNQAPKISRYWRVLVRNDTKGFIVKIPEFSILFKEQ
jgi:hypothetical protein